MTGQTGTEPTNLQKHLEKIRVAAEIKRSSRRFIPGSVCRRCGGEDLYCPQCDGTGQEREP